MAAVCKYKNKKISKSILLFIQFLKNIDSAALSTISGAMGSLACVCITDFVRPSYKFLKEKDLKENSAALITKLLALCFGLTSIGLAYLCKFLGSTILQLALSILGLLGGPILGVISLGMFIPSANWFGALTGLICSVVLNVWIGIGAITYVVPESKPFSTAGCELQFNILVNATTMSPPISADKKC